MTTSTAHTVGGGHCDVEAERRGGGVDKDPPQC